MLVRIANRDDPDQCLHCLSIAFWQATSAQNFRKFKHLNHILQGFYFYIPSKFYFLDEKMAPKAKSRFFKHLLNSGHSQFFIMFGLLLPQQG